MLKQYCVISSRFILLSMLILSGCDAGNVPTNTLSETSGNDESLENGAIIPGQYVVVLKSQEQFAGKTARQVLDEMTTSDGVQPLFRYESALTGFAGTISSSAIERLRKDPLVDYIENDRVVTLPPFTTQASCQRNPNQPKCQQPDPTPTDPGPAESTPWGITRVKGGVSYTGSSVAWILDTGIDLDHPDLNVDASRGFSAFQRGKDSSFDDGNGHGTHVSGTIAAINNSIGVIGVAAGATVIPVKVLSSSGSGSYSGVIAGVNHVAKDGSSGDVANMSLGGPVYQALDDAIMAAAAKGIRFSLAAGNETDDANNHSPARTNGTNVYTISAMDDTDTFAWFSNFGSPVDYAAPGVSVESTWKGGGYKTISGTSMAAPHVAGILILGGFTPSGTVKGDPDGVPDPIASH